jgi:hypothetical protein
VRVSQPVEVEGSYRRRDHHAVVSVRDVVGRDGLAVLGREQVAGVHVTLAPDVTPGVLRSSPRPEDFDRGRVEVDDPGAGGRLGPWPVHHLVPDSGSPAGDRHRARHQVDRRPAKGKQLAAAGAGVAGELQQREKSIVGTRVEERCELAGGPHFQFLGLSTGPVDVGGQVVGDQALAHGVVEHDMEQVVGVL